MSRIHEMIERNAQRRAAYSHPDIDVLGVDANGLSPGDSGYDATTDPASPLYADPNAVGDPSLPDPEASFDPPLIPAPPLNTTIHALPGDAVVYDGSKGMPAYCVGSYSYFKGSPPETNGYVWGFDKINAPNSGTPARWIKVYGKRGFKMDTDPGSVILNILSAGTHGVMTATLQKDNWNWDDIAAGDLPDPWKASAAAGYGPLIGNPAMPDFANLRYATDTNQWFWYPSEAPEYATAESKRALALLNEQTAKALADAEAAQKVLDDQMAAELAEAQAQQDLADMNAQHEQEQAQQAADAAAQVQMTAQQAEESVTQSRLMQQEQELAMSAARQEQELAARQAQMELDAAQADMDYMKAHPEEFQPDRGTGETEEEEVPSDRGTGDEESVEGDVFGASRAVERMRERTGHAPSEEVLGFSRAVDRMRARKRQ